MTVIVALPAAPLVGFIEHQLSAREFITSAVHASEAVNVIEDAPPLVVKLVLLTSSVIVGAGGFDGLLLGVPSPVSESPSEHAQNAIEANKKTKRFLIVFSQFSKNLP